MAIQVTMRAEMEISVPVDPRDMGSAAHAPAAIEAAARDLLAVLPTGSTVVVGAVSLRRRRVTDQGRAAGRDSPAGAEDTALTPLEAAIAAAEAPAPPTDEDAANARMGDDDDPETPAMALAGQQPARGAIYDFDRGLPHPKAAGGGAE